jgi:S-layer protein
MDTSSVAGLETLNVTKADSVYVESADTTDINVSGATGGTVEVDGGKDVAVTDGSAVNNITIGGATAPAGTINVTDSVQDTGVITIDGGTDVTVDATVENTNASADVTGGAITIGGTTPATGTVSVTQNLNSDGTGDGTGDGLTGGAVTITGGSTVDLTVNATSDAKDETESEGTQIGALKVNSDGNTTDVNVTQNDDVTTFTKEGSDMVASTSVVTFKALSAGETVTVDGLVFEASENLDAEQVAAAFSNLGDDSGAGNVPTTGDIVSAGGPVTNGFYIGNTTGAWTSGAADGANVTFTKKDHSADDIVVASSDTASKPGTDFTQGDAAVADSTSTNTVAYGAVTIDEDGTAAASIENISVDGYVNSTIGATNSVDALKTLLLTNSAGTMDVTTAAATLDLTVDDVNDAVTLNATSLLDLTLNAVGEDSAFGLTSADTTDLTIDATADLDLTGSTFTNLVNATIEGAGAVTLDGQVAATLETIDAATNTGGVTASVNGNATAVTGGDGDDEITVLNADTPIDQEISLGAGDDAIDLSNGGTVTAVAPTATIDGGAGTDLLAMDSIAAAGADAAFAAKFTNFELLEIAEKVVLDNGVDTAQDVTVDLSVLEYDYVITNGTTDSADVDISGSALILDNMANGGTVELNDTQDETYLTTTATGAGSIKVNVLDADANTADSLNLFTMVDAGLVEAQGVETINVTGSNSVFLKDTDLTTVTVNGNHATALDADGNPTAYADIHVGLDATSTNVELVDASASMGALIFDSLDDTTATVINGGHGNDEISIAGQNDEVYAGAGDDRIIVADTADAAKVEGGDGNDLFDMTGATLGKEAYATILDFEAGDQIAVNASSFKSQGVVVTDPSELTLTDWFTAAFNQTVATEAIWFQHNDNTYIVDNTTTDDFVAGDDVIIKLAGVVDLDQAAFNDSGNLEMA